MPLQASLIENQRLLQAYEHLVKAGREFHGDKIMEHALRKAGDALLSRSSGGQRIAEETDSTEAGEAAQRVA